MAKHLNPSYGKKMNDDRTSFTLVAHVPELPAASYVYENKVVYNKKDACFYRCRLLDGAASYIWEPVTFGIKRQFVLPVAWIVTRDGRYNFDDEVAALRNIVTEMSKYVTHFQEMYDSDDPNFIWINPAHDKKATEKQYIVAANEVIWWVNEYCQNEATQLDTIPAESEAEVIAVYINKLIGALNPHAGFSIEMDKIYRLKTEVFQKIADISTEGINDAKAKAALDAIKSAAVKGVEILKNPFEEENNG